MKRSEHLQPLSHDHHQGLVMARRLHRALNEGEAPDVLGRQVVAFWHEHLVQHFDEEETLLPVLYAQDGAVLADRLLDEHAHLKGLVSTLEADPGQREVLEKFVEALQAHIRFEERELFPYVEQHTSPDTLERVGALLHDAHAA